MKLFLIISVFLSFSNNVYSKDIEILSDIVGYGNEIKNHFKVHVNYRGILENGTEFDSSYKRNKPFIFQIGLRQVILGWEKGLMGMKVGGKRTIKIPSVLAYGSRGSGDLIPPNTNLIFEIEIIKAFPPDYKNLLAKDLRENQKKGMIVIDIRPLVERKKTGIIEGSLTMTAFDNKGNFNSKFIKFYKSVANKNNSVVFVSTTGEISAILANGFVEQLEASNIYTLVGGIQEWIKEGRNLIK